MFIIHCLKVITCNVITFIKSFYKLVYKFIKTIVVKSYNHVMHDMVNELLT